MRTLCLAVCFLLIQSIVTLKAEETFEYAVHTKAKEFSYGSHPVLQADVVEVEFKVDKTQTRYVDIARSQSTSPQVELLTQNVGFQYRATPNEFLTLSQSLQVGLSKRQAVTEDYFNDEVEDQWSQLQRTEISLQNESQTVQFQMYQQYRQVFKNGGEIPEAFFKYGGSVDVKLTRNFSISPEWWSEERTDSDLSRTNRERYGTGFSWKASKGLTIKPEIYVEQETNSDGQLQERQGAGLTLVKSFPEQKMSVEIRPLYIEEHTNIANEGNQNIERLDGSISWTPLKEFSLKTGGVIERQDYENTQQRNNVDKRVYSSLTHQPIDEFSLNIRGDYRIKSTGVENDPFQDSEEAQLKISVSPELKINESLVASAQYLYEYRNQVDAGELPEEQALTVSLRGQF